MSLVSDLAKLDIGSIRAKDDICAAIAQLITANNYPVVDENLTKPWGAFWRFDNSTAEQFIAEAFPGLSLEEAQHGVKDAELSPKILLVAPRQRLSWQKHARRAERWRSVAGPAGYHKSLTDEQDEPHDFSTDEVVQFDTGERHRLISGDGWSIVAEIWQHTDPVNLSDEDDIVRIADDYNRS